MKKGWRVLAVPFRALWRWTAPLREPETDATPMMGWRTLV